MEQLLSDFISYLSRALGIVAAGVLLSFLVRPAAIFVLHRLRFDSACDRVGIATLMRESGIGSSPSRFIGNIAFWAIILFAVLASLGPLGLESLADTFNQVILYAPRILVAVLIVLLGTAAAGVVAELARRGLSELGVNRTGPFATLTRVAVIFVSAILAANVLGIQATILISITVIVLGGVVLTAALALGLGLRQLSQNVAAGRYLAEGIEEGDEISVNGVSGTVERIGHAMTTIRTTDDEVHLLPNSQFLEYAVRKRKPLSR
ncbi:MAG: mechanosensitive ion channel [Rubrobacter sp.]|nr:mechanosensitive ion channel [Rubrobacter sp.]